MKRSSAISKPAAQADKPIFCTQCGTPNTKDSKFCKECGESLVTTYAPKISPDPFVQAGLGREEQLQRLLDMAFWHNEAGNIGAALLACQAALALNDRSVSAWSLTGCLYEKRGDLEKAVEAFEVVMALNPDSVADAQKLEALRRGVHVKAVPQPVNYRWVPPALARYVQEKPSAPAIGAAGAAVAVLILGLLAIHPLFSAGNRSADTTTPNLSAARSAWSGNATGADEENISPSRSIIAQTTGASPAQRTGMSNVIAPAIALPNRDPFFGSQLATTTPAVSHQAQHHDTGEVASNKTLPPLGVPNPPSSSDVQPLPPPVQVATAIPQQVPQHTIPVTGFPPAGQLQGTDENSLPGDNGAPPPASRISITVHGNPADGGGSDNNGDGAAPVPNDSGPVHHLVLSQDSGANLQQTALTYQEQGNYSSAQAAYKRAIAAYQADLDAGRDTDAAVRGIQACETGLQICRQSQ